MSELTITEFLLARIEEDEGAAREATPGPWTAYGDGLLLGVSENPEVCREVKTWNMWHLSTFDPARVLAECGAKRELIRRVGNPAWAGFEILASIYADHADFDPKWVL